MFVFFSVFPWSIRRRLLCFVYKYKIDDTAYLSRFSVITPLMLTMGPCSYIGAGTVVKGVSLLSIGAYGYIGTLNWIYGFPEKSKSLHFMKIRRNCALHVCNHASITSRHIIDCTDEVVVGEYSTVAGYRTQIITHSIDLRASRQSCKSISIGKYCFIGTNCVLLGGANFPDSSVLAAHSSYSSSHAEGNYYYGGVPARPIKPVGSEEKYFKRSSGYVY